MDQTKLNSLVESLIKHADAILQADGDTMTELVRESCAEGDRMIFRPDPSLAIGIRDDGLFLMNFALENNDGNTISVARLQPGENFTIVSRSGDESFLANDKQRDLKVSDLKKLVGNRASTVH